MRCVGLAVARCSRYPQLPFDKQRCPGAQVVVPHVQTPLEQVPALPALQLGSPEHTQLLELQPKPAAHLRPQEPQLAASFERFLQPPIWQQT